MLGGPLQRPAINISDVLGELPAMPFRVNTLVDTVAVELFSQWAGNLRAGSLSAFVVSVHVVHEDVEPLAELAAERAGALARRALGREPDHDEAVRHLKVAVHDAAILIGHS